MYVLWIFSPRKRKLWDTTRNFKQLKPERMASVSPIQLWKQWTPNTKLSRSHTIVCRRSLQTRSSKLQVGCVESEIYRVCQINFHIFLRNVQKLSKGRFMKILMSKGRFMKNFMSGKSFLMVLVGGSFIKHNWDCFWNHSETNQLMNCTLSGENLLGLC